MNSNLLKMAFLVNIKKILICNIIIINIFVAYVFLYILFFEIIEKSCGYLKKLILSDKS